MKKLMFYDTETNGIPEWHKPSNDPCQPHVIQLHAELVDEGTQTVIETVSHIIKPEGWVIPDDIAEMTGITTERAIEEGVPIAYALAAFVLLWQRSDLRVGHNESFDMRMLRIEFKRCQDYGDAFADEWKTAPAFCTQSNSIKICKLPPTVKMIKAGRKHHKSPNLAEAYKHFTGRDMENAHTADADVAACKAVYFGIQNYRKTEGIFS